MSPLDQETRAILALVMQASIAFGFAEDAGYQPTLREIEAAEEALATLRARCGYPARETPDWTPELTAAARIADDNLAAYRAAFPPVHAGDFDPRPPVWMR